MDEQKIRSYMRRYSNDYRDSTTNELNATWMTEGVTWDLGLCGIEDEIPERVYEIAFEVCEAVQNYEW